MASYSSFKKLTSESIIDGAITGAALANNSVTTSAFNSASVRTTDISDGAVGTTQLASTIDLSTKTVTYRPLVSADFANGAISGGQLESGAIATNLGYTPISKAGGTVTGQLKLPAGSVSSPSVRRDDSLTLTTGIYFPNANEISIATSGASTTVINSSGHVRSSNIPAFYASGNGGWYYGNSFGGANAWREINWTWNVTQQGGSNVGANGRFTAPVGGYYYFYVQSYYYSDSNNSNAYCHFNIGKNGSPTTLGGRTPHTMYAHGVNAHHCPGVNCSIQHYLNQGDYCVPMPYWGGNQGRIHGDHSLWCGYLIG